jgi:hypothetical protein
MMVPQCFDCKHLAPWNPKEPPHCAAFPDGVPEAVFKNLHDHRKEYPGDHGVRFEPSESAIELGVRLPSGDFPPSMIPQKPQTKLREEMAVGADQAKRGQVQPIDEETAKSTKSHGRQRLAKRRSREGPSKNRE